MKDKFKNAIQSVGGQARLKADETQCFFASIQPIGFDGDGHSEIGMGFLKKYRLFAEHNETTQKLRENDMIVFDDHAYIIKCLSPLFFRGRPAYFSGILTLCEAGD